MTYMRGSKMLQQPTPHSLVLFGDVTDASDRTAMLVDLIVSPTGAAVKSQSRIALGSTLVWGSVVLKTQVYAVINTNADLNWSIVKVNPGPNGVGSFSAPLSTFQVTVLPVDIVHPNHGVYLSGSGATVYAVLSNEIVQISTSNWSVQRRVPYARSEAVVDFNNAAFDAVNDILYGTTGLNGNSSNAFGNSCSIFALQLGTGQPAVGVGMPLSFVDRCFAPCSVLAGGALLCAQQSNIRLINVADAAANELPVDPNPVQMAILSSLQKS